MSELNLILLGPPGAGKGTQAERLQEDFDVPYIATGEILRHAVADDTELGRIAKSYMDAGDLVPDDVITTVILKCVTESVGADGFLLDGFPRTVAQAEALERELADHGRELSAVLLIEAPVDEIVRRLSGRRVCPNCGHNYHVDFAPPRLDGICDIDGAHLRQREDDREETVRHRLDVYAQQTAPLADFFEERGLLRRFDGGLKPNEVSDHLRAAIQTLRLEQAM